MLKNNRGDTIVEVLIAIAVVGMALASGFILVRQSVSGAQRARERDQANTVARSQIEMAKSLAASNPPKVASMSSPFCVRQAGLTVELYTASSDCTLDSGSSVHGAASSSIAYRVSVVYGSGVLTASIAWDRLGGGTETLVIPYGVTL